MPVSLTFLPAKNADILNYVSQVNDVVTATGFDPTTVGLTADLVTALTAALTAAQSANDAANAAVAAKNAATTAFTGPSGALANLKDLLRNCANAARVSSVSDDMIASIGVARRSAVPTLKTPATEAPEINLVSVAPGVINLTFRTSGSAAPRARAQNAIGIQVSVVDASSPVADGEANRGMITQVSRTPAQLNTVGYPANVRLYGRWITARGLTSPWTAAIAVAVTR
jgi:hypothetical protein